MNQPPIKKIIKIIKRPVSPSQAGPRPPAMPAFKPPPSRGPVAPPSLPQTPPSFPKETKPVEPAVALEPIPAEAIEEIAEETALLEEIEPVESSEEIAADLEEYNEEYDHEEDDDDDDSEYLPKLKAEEKSLYTAYQELMSMTRELAVNHGYPIPIKNIPAQALIPRLRPEIAVVIKNDLYQVLQVFKKLYPNLLGRLTGKEDDNTLFKIAEMANNPLVESFLINFMQVDLEIEACKIRSKASKTVKEGRMIKEETVDLFLEQRDLARAFIEKLKAKHLPINEDALINNYLRMAAKEPERAYKILTSNPAFFSPIIIEKIPRKFLGLIKPGAKDGIAMNKKIARILKSLKT